jgi:hypothetical protein
MQRRQALLIGSSAALVGLVHPGLAYADDGRDVVGSWSGTATSTTVPLPPLRTLFTFGADGTVNESRRLYVPLSPLGPLLATPGHGAWRKTGRNEYSATIQLLYQGTAEHPTAPGQVIGSETVRYRLLLVNGGRRLQGVIEVEVKDAAGNVVFLGPGTLEADRIRVEALP